MVPQRPNILLITCHDLGRFLGCYGIPTVQTPHLDGLADDGILFTQAFCTAPQCSPSRASLFTGRFPHSNGVMGLAQGTFAWDLNPDERHLGQVLHEEGYTTALVGVHHESRRADADTVAKRCGMDVVLQRYRPTLPRENALDLLERYAKQDQPFYLQVGFISPHRVGSRTRDESDYRGFLGDFFSPDDELGITIPPYLRDTPSGREEMAELQGSVRHLDGEIGHVLAGLCELGLEENTLVLFTTDHGLSIPRAKCTLYDPGLEVALIWRYPARGWVGGRTQTEVVSNVDNLPTLLETIGIPVSETVQGRSLLPLLDGQTYEKRDAIFGEMTYHGTYLPMRCIRTEQYKLIVNFSPGPAFMRSSGSWRPRMSPVVPANPAGSYRPTIELYDLEKDPLEQENVASDAAYETVKTGLLARVYDWMRSTDDPLLEGAIAPPMHEWAMEALIDAASGTLAAKGSG